MLYSIYKLLSITILGITIINASNIIVPNQEHYEIANRVLSSVPLIDGHNDLADNIRKLVQGKIKNINLTENLSNHPIWGHGHCERCQTDLNRLKTGKIGAQFWSSRTLCTTQHKDAVAKNLEQIDIIKRLVQIYPDYLEFVKSSQGILKAFENKKIASLIGVEGGHSIDNRLAVLRMFYELGVRYMTLTHMCNNPWADSSLVDKTENPEQKINNGLSEFGKKVVLEMNRLGMLVDISHTSIETQQDVMNLSRAPIIYSHSNAFAICNHHRNVHDHLLEKLKEKDGIIMVNFYNLYVTCSKNATIHDVIEHFNYIKNKIGIEYIGIAGDFDGIDHTPIGLENVSKYVDLFARLAADTNVNWSEEDLKKLAGLNFLRVFKQVEKIRDELKEELPFDDWIDPKHLINNSNCLSSY